MRKKIFVMLIFSAIFIFSACKKEVDFTKSETDALSRAVKALTEMENYGSIAILKRHSNKGKNTYETRQFYKSTGEYRLEIMSPESVAGSITIFDGKMVSQYNPRVEGKILMDVPESRARDEMFLGLFIKNYLNSEDVSVSISKTDASVCTVLEAHIPGDHPYLAKEKLWVDNKTNKPEKLVIYDKDGKISIEVIFTDFEYNMKLEESLFKVTIHE